MNKTKFPSSGGKQTETCGKQRRAVGNGSTRPEQRRRASLTTGIPEGWEERRLGELIKTVSDTFKFPQDKVCFLNTSDIYDGKVLNHALSNVSRLPGQAKKSIKEGDFLFSEIRPANRRFALIDFEASNYVVSTKLMVLRCGSEIMPSYLRYFLTSVDILQHLQILAESRSGTFPQITFTQVADLEIKLPPISEQRPKRKAKR